MAKTTSKAKSKVSQLNPQLKSSQFKATQLNASQSNSTQNSIRLGEQIWPLERDILFRPARLKYVRKLIKDEGCVFCNSAKNPKSEKSLCVYKTKYSQIVLNKFPYNSGHLLVLPLSHTGQIFDLSEEVYLDLQKTVRLAMEAIQAIYEPNGFNLGMNHGATSGAGIPDHLHYHIVPRWNGDLNFFPLIAETKLVIETVEDSYKNFEMFFRDLDSSQKTKKKGKR